MSVQEPVEKRRPFQVQMPRTLALFTFFMIVTASFDVLVLAALHGHEGAWVRSAGRLANVMANSIPAIDHMRDYIHAYQSSHTTDAFRSRGLADPANDYRALIAMNWLLLGLFVPVITLTIAYEVRKNEKRLLDYLAKKTISNPRAIVVGFAFACFLLASYLGWTFASYIALIMPAYFLLYVWCYGIALVGTWILFACLCIIPFLKKNA